MAMTSSLRLALSTLTACLVLAGGARGQGYPPPSPPPSPPPPAQPPPGGGQTPTPTPRTVKLATLDGTQETPPKTTNGFGAGVLVVDESSGKVRGFVVTSGLVDPTAAHVHLAARGAPGAIIVPMTGGPDLWVVPDAAAPLTADQIAAFKTDGLYFNVHTKENPDGEIRGQLDKKGTLALASLDGPQETPPVMTKAFGAGTLAVEPTTGQVSGFVVTSGLPTGNAAHVHQAARGTPGAIIVPMVGAGNFWVIPDAAPAITNVQRTAFTAGQLYENVHTPANPNGEIRGQLD